MLFFSLFAIAILYFTRWSFHSPLVEQAPTTGGMPSQKMLDVWPDIRDRYARRSAVAFALGVPIFLALAAIALVTLAVALIV